MEQKEIRLPVFHNMYERQVFIQKAKARIKARDEVISNFESARWKARCRMILSFPKGLK